MQESDEFERLIDTLKLCVAALREQHVPFMLGGSLATWARGGPEPKNDLDLMVKPQDAEKALEALTKVGMRPERPPEEWLLKAQAAQRKSGQAWIPGLDRDVDRIKVLAAQQQ